MSFYKRIVFFIVLISFPAALITCACVANQRQTSSGQRHHLRQGGIDRYYVVRHPTDLPRNDGLVPLVMVLHGGGGNAGNAEDMTGFTEKAKKEGFIVVYPEGTGRFRRRLLTWNARHCCGKAMENGVDDVGFIRALIDKLLAEYPVDPKRIYCTGMSNGGMMTHRLGIELSDRFAAIAPVVATLFGDENRPLHPVSALMINGMQDKSVPFEGGAPGGRFSKEWDGTPTKPAQYQATFWADADGCIDTPDRYDRERYVFSRYHCPGSRAVELYLIKDNGHAWPGGRQGSRLGDKPSKALNATDVIWEFFKAHSKK